jgi:GNAT superfamily N-acetyltransferase
MAAIATVFQDIHIVRGRPADYQELARFHYCRRLPVAPALVGTAWHLPGRAAGRAAPGRAGAVVLTMPCLNNAARTVATGAAFVAGDPRERARLLNRDLRTIARVVVHPRYRGIGVGTALARWALEHAGTRYVEAIAELGAVHPFLIRAGMRRIAGWEPGYFLWERGG